MAVARGDQFILLGRIGEEGTLRENRREGFKPVVTVGEIVAVIEVGQIAGRGDLHDQRGSRRSGDEKLCFQMK